MGAAAAAPVLAPVLKTVGGAFLKGAVGSLASGFLGKIFGGGGSSTTTTPDLVGLREEAERAGFNPLTALRYAGPGQTTTTEVAKLSPLSVLADAVGAGLDAAVKFDPMDQMRQQVDDAIQVETLLTMRQNRLSPNVPMSAKDDVRDMFIEYRDPSGNVFSVIDPDLQEYGWRDQADFLRTTYPMLLATGAMVDWTSDGFEVRGPSTLVDEFKRVFSFGSPD